MNILETTEPHELAGSAAWYGRDLSAKLLLSVRSEVSILQKRNRRLRSSSESALPLGDGPLPSSPAPYLLLLLSLGCLPDHHLFQKAFLDLSLQSHPSTSWLSSSAHWALVSIRCGGTLVSICPKAATLSVPRSAPTLHSTVGWCLERGQQLVNCLCSWPHSPPPSKLVSCCP